MPKYSDPKLNACTRKVQYASMAKAKRAAVKMGARPYHKRQPGKRLNAYHCHYCGKYHIGNTLKGQ